MKIGYRTIKTAIGAPIAISIAQLLGISNVITAGILTILSIQPSQKRSIINAKDRFLACIIAIIFSLLFFNIFGYYVVVVGVMLLFFIPLTVYLKINEGIVTSSVIILNLYSEGNITLDSIVAQLLLIFIGIGTALLLNLYMPSLDHKLKKEQEKLELKFQKILSEIALYIRDENRVWDGKELTEADEILNRAMKLVSVDKENHLMRDDHTFYDYFNMRTKQFNLLRKMLPLVTHLEKVEYISNKTADFFEKLSDSVHPGNTANIFIEELNELFKTVRADELPKTREEFETRANLFRLLHEIQDYLYLKHNLNPTNDFKSKNKMTGK